MATPAHDVRRRTVDRSARRGVGGLGENVLRQVLLSVAGSDRIKEAVTRLPVSGGIAPPSGPGERTAEVVEAVRTLAADGRLATIDYLGEDTLDEDRATATVDAYVALLETLGNEGLARRAEV